MWADYTSNLMFKVVFVITTFSSSFALLAQTASQHFAIQYGAIGVLGVCAIYVTTKLVPSAIKSRQKETEAFISTLTTEREKLVSSMERMEESHNKEVTERRKGTESLIKELNVAQLAERSEWLKVIKVSNVVQDRNVIALKEIAVHLDDLKEIRTKGSHAQQ